MQFPKSSPIYIYFFVYQNFLVLIYLEICSSYLYIHASILWHFFRIAKYFITYWGMLKLNNYGVRSYSLYNLVSCLPVLQQCHLNFLLVSSKFSWLLFWYVCSLVYAQWFDLAWIGVFNRKHIDTDFYHSKVL